MERRLWFRAKTHGWGWTPATWQGWLATAVYASAFGIWIAYWVRSAEAGDRGVLKGFAPLLLLTAGFILLCWTKGEKPRWSWGRNKGTIR
ncbi:MAG: hypothetical protein ACT4N4_14630 [Rhodospirillales bacterium]